MEKGGYTGVEDYDRRNVQLFDRRRSKGQKVKYDTFDVRMRGYCSKL